MFYSMYAYLSHLPRLHALGMAIFAYVIYYLIQVVKVSGLLLRNCTKQ